MSHKTNYSTLEREALICGRCGYCRSACPVYRVIGWETAAPRGKISLAKEAFSKNQSSIITDEFVRRLAQCTLCGACANECSTDIDTRQLWLDLRRRIAAMGKGPKAYEAIRDTLLANKNITSFSNEDRLEWAQDLDDPEQLEPRAGAEVCYFVGCVSAYFPQAAQIPLAVAEILTESDIDFTTMGGEEWCCGFPLISTGYVEDSTEFIKHNVEKIKEMNIHTLIASCASCYHVWKHDSEEALKGYNLEVFHTTEYLAKLVKEGKIELNELDEVVTYHDPCDLGRNGGVFDAPREIITSIPGVKFVELAHNKKSSLCCGGGGNLQSVDAETAAKITALRVEEIKATGATIVVSACQQCEQMLIAAIQKAKLPVRVMDISQLILEAM
ncbi:MAG: (Fe-S)-binding protein [Syntrophomonadaceae bacterium]|jgi:heterodisulfide reductase subunit D